MRGIDAPEALTLPPSVRPQTVGGTPNPRKAVYAEVLSRVREVLIGHMAKPEEVLIEEDDSGEIVRGASSRGGTARGARLLAARVWPVM